MKIEVLDHGYVEVVETWGSDERIIEAARMSTGKGFLGWQRDCDCPKNVEVGSEPCPKCGGRGKIDGDEKLLSFLWKNSHATPFEMAGLVIEVQAPIMVYREWHRHRTQSYNELSARYTPLPDVNYVPAIDRLMVNADQTNRQAGTVLGADRLNEGMARMFQERLRSNYAQDEHDYQAGLQGGIPKELARLCIPVGRYSRMRASANLRNWLGFLTLRMAPNAQWEIRQYANAVGSIVAEKFPRTWALFSEGK